MTQKESLYIRLNQGNSLIMINSWRSLQQLLWENQTKSHFLHWWKQLGINKTWLKIFFANNECDHPKGIVQMHNCIKSRFEREERFQGGSKLKEALLDRTNFIKEMLPKTLTSCGLNLYKALSLYKNYRHHVNTKWQAVPCSVQIKNKMQIE